MSELTNTLADLAERVKEANLASVAAQRQSIEKAFEAGFLLCLAKEQCGHGDWLPFLSRSGVHERQARRLMTIASSGLQIGHVSEIGGIRANLDYISKFQLPEPGEIVFVGTEHRDPDAAHPGPCAWIECAPEHPGYFNVTAINSAGECRSTTKPAKGKTLRCRDGFFNGVWVTLEMILDGPHAERDFTAMPAELLDRSDDCPFVDELEAPSDLQTVDVSNAPLPMSYREVKAAVDLCDRELSAESLLHLSKWLLICESRSHHWPNDARMFGTWARISDESISQKIERIYTLAKLKWGSVDLDTLRRTA